MRTTTKKGRQLILEKKVHSRENPGYAYDVTTYLLTYFMTASGTNKRSTVETAQRHDMLSARCQTCSARCSNDTEVGELAPDCAEVECAGDAATG